MYELSDLSQSRNGRKVRLVAVHTTEGGTVESIQNYFLTARKGSSHALADDVKMKDNLISYDRAAWTLRSGNAISDNLELCGYASWTRTQWINEHPNLLLFASQWVADRCKARNIPCIKLSPADVAAGKSGVIGHVDWTKGMNDGTHWDPGPGFPWDIVIANAQNLLAVGTGGSTPPISEMDEMNAEERTWLKESYKSSTHTEDMVAANAQRTLESVQRIEAAIADLVTYLKGSQAQTKN